MSIDRSLNTDIHVLVVDDHPAVLEGLALRIGATEDLTIAGIATTISEAREMITNVLVDVVVIDRRLSDGDGVDLCQTIRTTHPKIRCILHSAGEIDSMPTVGPGAHAVVLKQLTGTDLIDTIRELASNSDSA